MRPTCGHTVQRVNEGVNPVTFWCPRCGTLKTDGVPNSETTHFMRRLIGCQSSRGADQIVVDMLADYHRAQQPEV